MTEEREGMICHLQSLSNTSLRTAAREQRKDRQAPLSAGSNHYKSQGKVMR